MKVYSGLRFEALAHNVFIIFLLMPYVISARLEVLDNKPDKVKLLNTEEMRFCYISFVRIEDEQYIIKQKKSHFLRKIVGVVRDAFTAHIVEHFGIAHGVDNIAHLVDVISAGTKFAGKLRKDWPATIHTIARGKMVKEQDSRFNSMNIKQADIGFRRDMLPWMVKHPTLIMIVALDTFLCNHDRHRGNLFYHAKSNSFCAIDMDSALKHNLCALACQNFNRMINNRKLHLTSKEIQALITYKKYLQFLINTYSPEDMLQIYDYFVEKAGFIKGTKLYTEKVALEIAQNREMIIQSRQDVEEVVNIVGKLIEQAQKRGIDDANFL